MALTVHEFSQKSSFKSNNNIGGPLLQRLKQTENTVSISLE